MRPALLDILVDPNEKLPLRLLDAVYRHDGSIAEADLCAASGLVFRVANGIPRMVAGSDPDQETTAQSFAYKWQQLASYGSPATTAVASDWLVGKYGFDSADEMSRYFSSRQAILDAGCGSGFSTSVWLRAGWGGTQWVGADISAAIDVAQERLGSIQGTDFVQADVMQMPFRESTFDTIFSEGVLHHTPSTRAALLSLAPLLQPGGEFLFYVYRKKAPIREFTDDYVRNALAAMDPQSAWNALRPLTALGKALAELREDVEVPEDIPLLGIKAGRHDVQRLIYWHIAKLYWNDAFTFEENNHVNFDWYHPRYAHRQTEDEVRQWCDEAGLTVTWFHIQESGFTVRATRN